MEPISLWKLRKYFTEISQSSNEQIKRENNKIRTDRLANTNAGYLTRLIAPLFFEKREGIISLSGQYTPLLNTRAIQYLKFLDTS